MEEFDKIAIAAIVALLAVMVAILLTLYGRGDIAVGLAIVVILAVSPQAAKAGKSLFGR